MAKVNVIIVDATGNKEQKASQLWYFSVQL